MNKEFIPYEQALALKELGFDEPCFGYYLETGEWTPASYSMEGTIYPSNSDLLKDWVSSPLYQQSFKFFRGKYNLCSEVYTVNMGAIDYSFQIRDLYSENYIHDNFEAYSSGYIGTFSTYEEAELECLKKLIEIVEKSTDLPN